MVTRRHKAREVVLKMLYQKDLNSDVAADTIRELWETRTSGEFGSR